MELLSQSLQSVNVSQRLVIIDSTIDQPQHLIKGVVPGTRVIVLDPRQESLPHITQVLQTHPPMAEVHLVSHGAPGQVQWGNGPLTLATLEQYAAELERWRFLLRETTAVFFYGCRVAAGELGQRFVQQLSQRLGTAIAANEDFTGSAALGGSWELSYRLPSLSSAHSLSTALPFTTKVLNTYPARLAASFSAQTTFASGNSPISVSVGDFNGDSQADLVTLNFRGSDLAILLGDGSGGFSSQTTFATGANPYSVSVGDFNGDSQADLVTANLGSNNVSILLGDSSGGFSSPTNFAAGTTPNTVVLGDFNGDSQADLVTSNRGSNSVSVLLGNGLGGFFSQTTFATDGSPYSVSVGDFNGDSQADLVTANVLSNNISVLLGNGSGGFSSQTTFAAGNFSGSVTVGDFNGDSRADLVTANRGSNNVSVLLGDGMGGFSSQTTFATGDSPFSVRVGDFNGDSRTDLVTANRFSNNVSVLLGNGSGGFSSQTTLAAGNSPTSVVVEDFNGDSRADLVAANLYGNSVSVLLNITATDHAISVDAPQVIEGNSGSQTLTFTVTRSGLVDNTSSVDFTIAGTANSGSDFNTIGGTSGATTTTGTINFAAGETSKTITLDVLGDTNFEPQETIAITLSNATAGVNTTISTATATSTILNDELFADFSVQSTVAAGTNPFSISVGDLNGDSQADLVTANLNSNSVSVLLGDSSGGFSSPTTFAAGTNPISVSVGDLNGDSQADLVTANLSSNNVSIFLGDGSGGFSSQTTVAAGTNPFSISVGDLNSDSQADLVTANQISNNVSIFLGDGSGGFSSQTTFAAGTNPVSVSVGDLNGDSQADLVTANFDSNNVSIFLGDGSGGFSNQTTFAAGTNPVSVSVGDLNGDSQADLVTANLGSNNVSIFLGDGSGGFSSQTTFAVGSLPYSVSVGDFNGDSQADLVTANQRSNNVSVLLGNGLGGFSSQTTFATVTTPLSVSVGDFNGDGQAEIAVASNSSSNVSILSSNTTLVALDSSSNLVITDRSNAKADNLTLTTDGNNFTLNDPNNLLTHVISGATGNATNTLTVPTSLVTGPQIIVNTGGGNDTVSGSSQAETINGGEGNDSLSGNNGNDNLTGGLGADTLNGGAGDDVLIDGASNGTPSSIALFALSRPAHPSFNSSTGWTNNEQNPRQVADVNGDGRADIIGFSNNGVFVALGQTDGTFGPAALANANFTRATGWTSNDSQPRQIADVNGDGRADIIGFSNNGVFVALGQTDGTFGSATLANANFTRATGWNSNDRLPRQLADVNGDGRADIVGFSNNGVFVALAQGGGTFGAATLANPNFTPATGWNSNDTLLRLVADVNGDNRADIVGFTGDGTYVALGQTDGTFGPVTLATNQFAPQQGFTSQRQQLRQIADVDGNGSGDVIGFGTNGVTVAVSIIVDDVLIGGAGNDRLVGGAGSDLLTGGSNADIFVFDANAAVSGTNQITDFSAVESDRIEIAQAAFGITNVSEIAFDATTGALTVAGTYNNTLAILTNPTGFDVNTHIRLV